MTREHRVNALQEKVRWRGAFPKGPRDGRGRAAQRAADAEQVAEQLRSDKEAAARQAQADAARAAARVDEASARAASAEASAQAAHAEAERTAQQLAARDLELEATKEALEEGRRFAAERVSRLDDMLEGAQDQLVKAERALEPSP